MKLIAAFAAVALACFAAPAFADPIECPLSQVRREITTPTPSGWWNTPIVNSLTETRVQTIGGSPALMCIYGPAGSIQRNAPEGQNCTARTGGFDCVSRIRPLPYPLDPRPLGGGTAALSSGTIGLRQTFLADLDTGATTTAAAADIWFQADTADLLYLTPRNGARLWVGDRSDRGRTGCAAGTHYTADRISLADLPAGSHVCVRTNGGHISQMRIVGLEGSASPRTLRFSYATWN